MNRMHILLMFVMMSLSVQICASESSQLSELTDRLLSASESDKTRNEKLEKRLLRELENGFLRGISRNVANSTDSVLALPFKFIARLYNLSTLYLFRFTFGSNGLTWNTVAHINNRIYSLCQPLTQANFLTMDKKRRSHLISQEEDGTEESVDPAWQKVQDDLLAELRHTIATLQTAVNCYDAENPQAGFLASCVLALSPHDTTEVSFYLKRAVWYIKSLMELIASFHSFEEAQQQHEQTKRRLSFVCTTLECIAQCIDPEGAINRTGRITFSKIGGSNSNQNSSLLDLNTF